jgi:signal transduction histidine kinase
MGWRRGRLVVRLDLRSYQPMVTSPLGSEAALGGLQYVQGVSRVWSLVRAYGLDVLIVIAAVESALEVALRHDPVGEPRTTPWFAVPAIALVVLLLLGRRRFRFAAPASVWLLAAALSFVDGRLVPFTASAVVAGFAAAFLLGNLRDSVQARIGLAIALSGAAIVVYNDPSHAAGELIFTPLLFAIGWLAGFAMRERAEQAEAAEARASLAEREREAAARIAVAEERSRIARRLVEAGDAERRRLERDLHDGAQSRLVALAVKLRLARMKAQAQPEVSNLLDESTAELQASLDELRELARGIHPAVLTDRGLAAALKALASRAPVPVEIAFVPPEGLPDAAATAVYFVVSEALTNVAKYARAEHATVAVRRVADKVVVEVSDDGVGGADVSGGSGLRGLSDRVSALDGRLELRSPVGEGTQVRAEIPLLRTG